MKKSWTQDEINYLKQAYAQGKREKTIAIDLDRSESSVSKAITRYKIRNKRDYAALDRKAFSATNRKALLTRPVKSARLDRTFNGTPCNWVAAEEVLRYLGSRCPFFSIKYVTCKPVYVFHNTEVSLTKVLMEANKICLQEGHPIFHIDGVTE
jgi:hypothetical protein